MTHPITDADRVAARRLREALADISGFWHRGDDDGLLCRTLAGHRLAAEKALTERLMPFLQPPTSISHAMPCEPALTIDRDVLTSPQQPAGLHIRPTMKAKARGI